MGLVVFVMPYFKIIAFVTRPYCDIAHLFTGSMVAFRDLLSGVH